MASHKTTETLTTTAADLNNIQAIKTAIDALPAAQRPRLGITIGGAGTSGAGDGSLPVAL